MMEGKDDQKKHTTEDESANVKAPRLIVVEPVLTLYFVVLISAAPLINQWVYSEVAALKGFDYSYNGGNGGGECGDVTQDSNDTRFLLQQEVQATTAQWMVYMDLAEVIPGLLSN